MTKTFEKMYEYIDSVCNKIEDTKLRKMFRKCYLNTLETTVKYDAEGNVFIITGDIEAMWLRDSSVQVSHYVRLAGEDADAKELVKSLLKRQFSYILTDPYANAFNESANGRGHVNDETMKLDIVWERKYEIDSLVYPLWLLNRYYANCGDSSVFDELFFKTYKIILDTLITEQDYKNSEYYFRRKADGGIDTLDNNGKGPDYAYTGMVRSAFRPSDDRCIYPFLVPANMFIIATLNELSANLKKADIEDKYAHISSKLCKEIENGIEKYATIDTEEFGRIYAYEVDGLGNTLLMDDANVPSLLSLPYLGYCSKDDELYLNTRKFVLSKANPYYFEGTAACGVGSPHTPKDYIWHIALVIEALTSADEADTQRILKLLTTTDAGTGFMHEGFDCNNPDNFTRSWFAWANTLFAIFIIDKVI
ncbi:MAG: glycoside hydrolase family 125 protein [Clostridia bacterium]|nr:glycoside hydrolase family 125 protein [Clostridia bacterium]